LRAAGRLHDPALAEGHRLRGVPELDREEPQEDVLIVLGGILEQQGGEGQGLEAVFGRAFLEVLELVSLRPAGERIRFQEGPFVEDRPQDADSGGPRGPVRRERAGGFASHFLLVFRGRNEDLLAVADQDRPGRLAVRGDLQPNPVAFGDRQGAGRLEGNLGAFLLGGEGEFDPEGRRAGDLLLDLLVELLGGLLLAPRRRVEVSLDAERQPRDPRRFQEVPTEEWEVRSAREADCCRTSEPWGRDSRYRPARWAGAIRCHNAFLR